MGPVMMWTPGLRSSSGISLKIRVTPSSIISSGASPAWWVIASAWTRSPLLIRSDGGVEGSK
jgi:hypothetical protein